MKLLFIICEKATGKVKHVQEMLAVWGTWVIDKPKGWNEIHPAWKVIVN
ncbi:MAG TPA: hypothetical protein VFP49_03920 [Nitrososphaeraceae archaeon]|nr:hypothetical protein [Nitrososphaeraceae archaeon]